MKIKRIVSHRLRWIQERTVKVELPCGHTQQVVQPKDMDLPRRWSWPCSKCEDAYAL